MKLLVCLLLCAACRQSSPPAGTEDKPPPPAPVAAAPAGLGCIQVIECLAACTQDAACHQACMDCGTDASRSAVSALLACNAGGEDADCEPEMQLCRGQQEPAEPPVVAATEEQMMPGQPHTTANILPWLTGYWQGVYYHYNFYADGRMKRSSGTPLYTEKTGRYACATLLNETGTVTQVGDLLIVELTAANENHCGDNTEAAPGRTLRLKIVWYQYNGPVSLKLVDIDCESGACSDSITRK